MLPVYTANISGDLGLLKTVFVSPPAKNNRKPSTPFNEIANITLVKVGRSHHWNASQV